MIPANLTNADGRLCRQVALAVNGGYPAPRAR